MAKNVSSGQGLFDDLSFVNPSVVPAKPNRNQIIAGTKISDQQERSLLDEWKCRMTVKKSVYLTQRVTEALALRHAGIAKTDRDFSKTVNAALESYLSEEIEALEEAGRQHSDDEFARYSQALSNLMAKRLTR